MRKKTTRKKFTTQEKYENWKRKREILRKQSTAPLDQAAFIETYRPPKRFYKLLDDEYPELKLADLLKETLQKMNLAKVKKEKPIAEAATLPLPDARAGQIGQIRPKINQVREETMPGEGKVVIRGKEYNEDEVAALLNTVQTEAEVKRISAAVNQGIENSCADPNSPLCRLMQRTQENVLAKIEELKTAIPPAAPAAPAALTEDQLQAAVLGSPVIKKIRGDAVRTGMTDAETTPDMIRIMKEESKKDPTKTEEFWKSLCKDGDCRTIIERAFKDTATTPAPAAEEGEKNILKT